MCLRCIIWQRVGKKTALSLNYLNAIESAAVAGRSSNCSATYIFMLALFAHLTFIHVAYIVWIVWIVGIVWCYMGYNNYIYVCRCICRTRTVTPHKPHARDSVFPVIDSQRPQKGSCAMGYELRLIVLERLHQHRRMQWVSVDLLTLGLCFNWDRARCTVRHQCHPHGIAITVALVGDQPPWLELDYDALKIRPSCLCVCVWLCDYVQYTQLCVKCRLPPPPHTHLSALSNQLQT